MASKRAINDFKRTNWDNKKGDVARKMLTRHFNELGKKVPKYVSEGTLPPSKVKQALKTLTNGYKKLSEIERGVRSKPIPQTGNKKFDNLYKRYEKTRVKYNKLVEGIANLPGRTDLEKAYLQGGEMFIPRLRNKPFYADNGFRKQGQFQYKTEEALKNKINSLDDKIKNLKANSDTFFYNTVSNKREFKDLITELAYNGIADKDQINHLTMMFSIMTEFEREIFVKTRLAQVRENYEINEETSDVDKTRIYNAMYYGMRNAMEENRGLVFEEMKR